MASSVGTELRALRRAAVDRTLWPPIDLRRAIERLQFIQADPIRAPARAQDLILRHRVTGYRAGDLERAYPDLPLVEDMVHVYGFLHRPLRSLLHPRRIARRFDVEVAHPQLRRAILDHLRENGASHPRAIQQALSAPGSSIAPLSAIVNAWGGQSNATTRMLDILQYRGLLDVVRRDRGIRVYGLASSVDAGATLSPQRRADGLIALLTRLYAPLPRASLSQLTWMLGERAIAREALRARIPVLLKRGVLRATRVDGVEYLWPGGDEPAHEGPSASIPAVRFLAPFDPLVWDRRRFGLLWGWTYRFEAYTPVAKRRLGYYALPLLWDTGEDAKVVGWANVSRRPDGGVAVDAGYVKKRPSGSVYRDAFDAEVARMERFLARDVMSDDEPIGNDPIDLLNAAH